MAAGAGADIPEETPALTREKAGIQVRISITQVIFMPGVNGTVAPDHELEIV